MMHTTKTPGSVFRAALLLGFASLGLARTAQASSNYPPVLAAAIAQQFPNAVKCVPLCTACHLTTAGGPQMMNVFGSSLEAQGLFSGNPALIAPALMKLAAVMPPIDSDHDGISDINELIAGDSPSIAGKNGQGLFCPNIEYGCGAHVAAAPPPADRIGLFSAGLVVLGFAMSRRRRGALRRRRVRK
jgi:hypothetical protein